MTNSISRKLGISEDDVYKVLTEFKNSLTQDLARGEDVNVPGIGKFCIKIRKERKWRNPKNGEIIDIRKRRVVTFKCSNDLKEKVFPPDIHICRRCGGKGKIIYRFYDTNFILRGIAELKQGMPLKKISKAAYWLTNKCIACNGTGIIDWIEHAEGRDLSIPLNNLEGCLYTFGSFYAYHIWGVDGSISEFLNLEKLITASQIRYTGPLKLDHDIIKKDAEEILRLAELNHDLFDYFDWSISEEENIKNILTKRGLSQYIPDKYVDRDFVEFPELT